MKKFLFLFFGLLALLPTTHGQSKSFPERAVKIFVPFTAGSGSDTFARYFAEQLTKTFGHSFIVENRPGASGVLAVMAMMSEPPDGHAILLASNSPIAVNPIVIKGLPYDPIKDLRPIYGIHRSMNALIVPPNSKIKTIADLVATSKVRRLSVGTYSAGYLLAIEWFASMTGAKVTSVSYKGGAQVFNDIMGGHLDFAIVDMGGVASLVKNGSVRAIAVSGESRYLGAPDVPTIKESYPDYVNYSWTSFYARSNTPDDITGKLVAAMQKAITTPEAKNFVEKYGAELMPYPPDAMRDFQRSELERFRRIAAAAGIEAQ